MNPSKVSRNAISFARFAVAFFSAPEREGEPRRIELAQLHESRGDAEEGRRQLLAYPHWAERKPEVVDLAEVRFKLECLQSEHDAHGVAVNARYEAHLASQENAS